MSVCVDAPTAPRVRLLGPLEVVGVDGPVDIGGPQARTVLGLLVAASGRVVPVDSLIDAVWYDSPPASAAGSLQTYVSRLRRAVACAGAAIVREPAGYRLDIARDDLDVSRFEDLADGGRASLDGGDAGGARARLVEALDLWRGPALLEVRDRPRLTGLAQRLDERRLAALEDRLAADLALGRHAAVLGELAEHVTDHPLRERGWSLLGLARYRAGQQAGALRALAEARRTLIEELGVAPGAELRELEHAILVQDPALDLTVGAAAPRTCAHATTTPSTSTAGIDESLRLIGRDAELAALLAAFDHARSGRPCLAVVEGEAGVGKTRLVEELGAEAEVRGGTVLWGRSLEGRAAPAYWPWLGVLRALRAGDPASSTDAVDAMLDATASLPPAAGDGPRVLLDGVVRMFEERDTAAPLVVVLEDVQWADDPSLDLAAQVAASLSSGPVLLVVTLRDGDGADREGIVALLAAAARRSSTCRVRLEGLEPSATADLLEQASDGRVDQEVAAIVHERVEGNPFYALEVQRLLAADGVEDAAVLAAHAVPIGVRDVVRQRLARLPEPSHRLLEIAAVAGRDIDVDVLVSASGRPLDDCIEALEIAHAHRFLIGDGRGVPMRFSHALVREVIVDELNPLRRARCHLAIADAIDLLGRGDDDAEIVAEHLSAAAPLGVGQRAADALERAADVAIARFAVSAACDLLGRSLAVRRLHSSGIDDPVELETLVKLAWARRAQGGYPGALAECRRGAELAARLGRDDIALEMQWAEWAGHDTACDFAGARAAAERFRARAEVDDDPLVQLAGFTAWGIQCWHDGDLAASAAAFGRAAQARSSITRGSGDLSLAAELLVLSTGFGLYVGEQVGAIARPEEAFAAAAEAISGNFPVAILWAFDCTSAMSVGDLCRVERAARRVLRAEAGETLGFWGGHARMYLGAVLVATGRSDEGRELFEAGHALYSAAGMRTGVAMMLAAAASAEVIAGDLDRASRRLAAAEAELAAGERWPVPFVLLAAADLAEASGASPADVLEQRRQAEAVARAQGAVAVAARARAATDGQRWEAPATGEHLGGLVDNACRARRDGT